MFNSFRQAIKVSVLEKYALVGPFNSADVEDELTELKATGHSILKRLKEKDTVTLSKAVESKGATETKCIIFGVHERLGKRTVNEPQVVLYRLFRQPSVYSSSQLKRRSCCSHVRGQDGKICINPYHYSAILKPDFSPTEVKFPTSAFDNEGCDSSGFFSNYTDTTTCELETSSKTAVSQTTVSLDDFQASRKRPKPWCFIAYWELNKRIGEIYEGFDEIINVHDNLPILGCEGFRLSALERTLEATDVVKQVRKYIGQGVQITREPDGIWIYNRSEYSLFANGTTLNHGFSSCSPHGVRVQKVPPGYSLKVYNYGQVPFVQRNHDETKCRTLSLPPNLRISFAKGWGTTEASSYCRPFVTSCPCWIEIHFYVFR